MAELHEGPEGVPQVHAQVHAQVHSILKECRYITVAHNVPRKMALNSNFG